MKAQVVYFCMNCKVYLWDFQRDGIWCPDCGSSLLRDEWFCSECEITEKMGRPDPSCAYGNRMCPIHDQ